MDQSSFVYDSYTLLNNRTHVDLTYTTNHNGETFSFSESYIFEKPLPESLETHRLLRMLHLASGISYYKLFFNTDIEHPYAMSTKESAFWNNIFLNGLGEYLYVNDLSADALATFGPQEGHSTPTSQRVTLAPKALLGIGGGKDSIVAGELLKSIGISLEGFVLATGDTTAQAAAVGSIMHVPTHIVRRRLDQSLINLQSRPDTYKGHIPVSLLFAITGALLAVTYSTSYVIVANEASASIPRAHHNDTPVNHQWSKSFEAEKLIQQYMQEYVHADLIYFSAIRPLSSVAVAKIFSDFPKYFTTFTSDNFGFRINAQKRPNNRWSAESPKTLSSYILLCAWLNEAQLLEVFGEDFMNNKQLEHEFLQLMGIEGEQPLDCVGTPQELRASLSQAYNRGILLKSHLMKLAISSGIIFADHPSTPNVEQLLRQNTEHAFPPALIQKLQTRITEVIA